MTQFQHPRHRGLTRPDVLTISIEDLADLYSKSPTKFNQLSQNHVMISCLDQRYSQDWIFGDYIDFDDREFGLYQKKLEFGAFFPAIKNLMDCNRRVYMVMPQPHPVRFDPGPGFTYIEFPEFYGLYHDLFLEYYGCVDDLEIDPTRHYLCLNKRNRISRQHLFCQLVDRGLLDRGLVSFLGHGMGSHIWFDKDLWQKHLEFLTRYAPGFDADSAKKALDIVPYSPDDRMIITDRLCVTGGWLPDIELYRNTFIDVIFETHENQNGSTVFTEKIFRSIYLGKPFLAVAGQNFLVELRKLGFETFDRWIDESYDLHPNLFVRTTMIVDLLANICQQSSETLCSLRKDMLPVIRHNQQKLKQLSRDLVYRLGRIDDFLTTQFDSF